MRTRDTQLLRSPRFTSRYNIAVVSKHAYGVGDSVTSAVAEPDSSITCVPIGSFLV